MYPLSCRNVVVVSYTLLYFSFLLFAHEQAEDLSDEDRDKRAVGHQDPKFGVKNALLGFVFHVSRSSR